jgi:chaperonin cofactor prefoldin
MARSVSADKIGIAVMAAGSSENEVLAQELESLGQRVHTVETRLAEVEKVLEGLEAAAQTTARAMEEISSHWDSVYRAMRRAE